MNVGDLVKIPWIESLGIITRVHWDSCNDVYHYRIHLSDGTWTQEQEYVVKLVSKILLNNSTTHPSKG
jgi:hypothetical protein